MDGSTAFRRCKLGDLTVDLGRKAVFRGDTQLPLPKLSYEFLLALMDAAPDLVSNEKLLDTVWRGVIVGPETIGQRAKLLRDALGDNSRMPRYVAVQRGLGYRLIPEVVRLPMQPALDGHPLPLRDATTAAPQAPNDLPPLTRRHAVVGLSLLVLSAIAYFAINWESHRGDQNAGRKPIATDGDLGLSLTSSIPVKSVAVLPFVDMSESHDQDYLADGLSEELINSLTKIPELRIPARTSSFYFKGKQATVSDIGQLLRVANVLVSTPT